MRVCAHDYGLTAAGGTDWGPAPSPLPSHLKQLRPSRDLRRVAGLTLVVVSAPYTRFARFGGLGEACTWALARQAMWLGLPGAAGP